jgi:hypothetical protein
MFKSMVDVNNISPAFIMDMTDRQRDMQMDEHEERSH